MLRHRIGTDGFGVLFSFVGNRIQKQHKRDGIEKRDALLRCFQTLNIAASFIATFWTQWRLRFVVFNLLVV